MQTAFATLNVRIPTAQIMNEYVDPLADFMYLERCLGYANTGEQDDQIGVLSASLWQVHDFFTRNHGEESTLSFEVGIELFEGRPSLRPLCAVWTLALSPLLIAHPDKIDINVYAYSDPFKARGVERSRFLIDPQFFPINSVPQNYDKDSDTVAFSASSTNGNSLNGHTIEFTPIRLVEVFEHLFPTINGITQQEFTITCTREP